MLSSGSESAKISTQLLLRACGDAGAAVAQVSAVTNTQPV